MTEYYFPDTAMTRPNTEKNLLPIVDYLDALLDVSGFEDYPNAFNGLQLESPGLVTKIGAAVDSGIRTIDMAVTERVDLLLVHHGLFWGGLAPICGPAYRKLAKAVEARLAIYSAHLPLDAHPEIGNNVLLAADLGLTSLAPFFPYKGRPVGYSAVVDTDYFALLAKIEKRFGCPVWNCHAGPDRVRNIGIVTGGAGAELGLAKAAGIDTFITGEGPHHTFALAEELGLNLIYAGHYATETSGVKALADRLASEFDLPWVFLDHPSGL
jgi:dinuclear metal center YbgI/SA1388 family protein